jgi:hypothetical protein
MSRHQNSIADAVTSDARETVPARRHSTVWTARGKLASIQNNHGGLKTNRIETNRRVALELFSALRPRTEIAQPVNRYCGGCS